jgi:GNAT superfamily N-acetyltransferase
MLFTCRSTKKYSPEYSRLFSAFLDQSAISQEAEIKEKDRIEIRDAHPGEAGDIAALVRDAYQQYERLLSEEAWRFYRSAISEAGKLENSEIITASLNSRLAGTVTLYLSTPPSAREEWPRDWAGIRLLAVSPDYRGHGVGRALVAECIDRCRRHGIKSIALHTTAEMVVARRLYETAGFTRVFEYDCQPLPDVRVIAYNLNLEKP